MRAFAYTILTVLSFTVGACSGATAPSDQEVAEEDAELRGAKTACSKASYDAALARYKAAVANAKARAKGDVCGDGKTLFEISNDLRAAVAGCGQFESVIRNSPWAAPGREALRGNLALAAVDGRLQIKDGAVVSGLAKSLEGAKIFGPAPGAYGNMSKIEFAADGKATFSRAEFDAKDVLAWVSSPASWRIVGKKLEVSAEGTTIEYAVSLAPASASYPHTVDVVFTPSGGGDVFRSLPSECEA